MKENTYKYSTDEDPDYAIEFKTTWDEDSLDYVAEAAAESDHSEHDGWESTWPQTFTIYALDGKELGKFEVEREFDPVFNATAL